MAPGQAAIWDGGRTSPFPYPQTPGRLLPAAFEDSSIPSGLGALGHRDLEGRGACALLGATTSCPCLCLNRRTYKVPAVVHQGLRGLLRPVLPPRQPHPGLCRTWVCSHPTQGPRSQWEIRVLTVQVLDLKRSRKKPRLTLPLTAFGSQLPREDPGRSVVLDGLGVCGNVCHSASVCVSVCARACG